MKNKLFIFFLLLFLVIAVISCSKTLPEAEPTPSIAVSAVPATEIIPAGSIAFIFSESNKTENESLYHQLAYIRMQESGYNIRNAYVSDTQALSDILSQLEAEGTEYVVITDRAFNAQAHEYISGGTNTIFMLYGESREVAALSYEIKLYEYYYLAGAALCSISESKSAAFIADSPDERTIRCINAFALGMKKADENAKVFVLWVEDAADYDEVSRLAGELADGNCDVMAYYMNGDNAEKAASELAMNYMTMSTHTMLTSDERLFIKPEINLDIFYNSIMNAKKDNIPTGFEYLGIKQGILSYQINTSADSDTAALLASLTGDLQNGYEVFTGPIYNEFGLIVPAGESLPDDDILHMLWFVDNVIGELPAG
ncbi:MAG: BMP family ABC transporter substrate-binding protein [Clostridia bacterium]|nr:BMP family ABC transporter substrate-binding protein [Clostridia bacterium]